MVEKPDILLIASNNFAEVHAIMVATEQLLQIGGDKPIFIFVDNRLAIRISTGLSSAPWCVEETKVIRANLATLSATRRVSLYWVPGHAGVEGNERADRSAKQGARNRLDPPPSGVSQPGGPILTPGSGRGGRPR